MTTRILNSQFIREGTKHLFSKCLNSAIFITESPQILSPKS